ncbi:MAG: hypothetical protein NG740_03985, partial [Omnitrophica bacterium]|nr:hypothetical protein [Candidatus Omnitrophota bacterium]
MQKKTISFRFLALALSVSVFFTTLPIDYARTAEAPRGRGYTPESFSIPQNLATIADSWSPDTTSGPDKRPTIIHIQDAHCNYYAQRKICEIIEYLNKSYGINVINLEGGKGSYDLSVFTDVENNQARREVSDYFLREGVINGAEFFAINNPDNVTLWGIEETGAYIDNLMAYRKSIENKKTAGQYIAPLTSLLSGLEKDIYSDEIIEFEHYYKGYVNDEIDFSEFIIYIAGKARNNGLRNDLYPNVGLLAKSIKDEKNINSEKANTERNQLIDALQKTLSNKELEELAKKVIHFKEEEINEKEFYAYIARKARSINADMRQFRELEKYILYASEYRDIDKTKITDEIDKLDSILRSKLYVSDEQKELGTLTKNVLILKKMLNLSITRKDYEYYLKEKASSSSASFISFIRKHGKNSAINKIEDALRELDRLREDVSKSYEYTFRRDHAFLKNLKFSPLKTTILITGGFHSRSLKELFKENNISFVSILPQFKSDKNYTNPYAGLVSGEQNSAFDKISKILTNTLAVASILSDKGIYIAANGERAFLIEHLVIRWRNALAIGHDGAVFRRDNGEVIGALDKRGNVVDEAALISPAEIDIDNVAGQLGIDIEKVIIETPEIAISADATRARATSYSEAKRPHYGLKRVLYRVASLLPLVFLGADWREAPKHLAWVSGIPWWGWGAIALGVGMLGWSFYGIWKSYQLEPAISEHRASITKSNYRDRETREAQNSFIEEKIKNLPEDLWANRTAKVKLNNTYILGIKCLQDGEDEAALEHEVRMMEELKLHGIDVPVPIRARRGSYVFTHEGALPHAPPEANIKDLGHRTHKYIAYIAHKDYFVYPEDIKTLEDMQRLAKNSITQLAQIHRAGYVHTSLSPLTHDVSTRRQFLWNFVPLGAVRNLAIAISFANIRLSGLADFAHARRVKPQDYLYFEIGSALTEWAIAVTAHSCMIPGIQDEQMVDTLTSGFNDYLQISGIDDHISAEEINKLRRFVNALSKGIWSNEISARHDGSSETLDMLVGSIESMMGRIKRTQYYKELMIQSADVEYCAQNSVTDPTSMIRNGKFLYVTDRKKKCIVEIDTETWESRSIAKGSTSNAEIIGIEGDILSVADFEKKCILKIDIHKNRYKRMQGDMPERKISVKDGKFQYTVNFNRRCIVETNIETGEARDIAKGKVSQPRALLKDDDLLYVADFGKACIIEINVKSNACREITKGAIFDPKAMAKDGNILYVVDANKKGITKITIPDSSDDLSDEDAGMVGQAFSEFLGRIYRRMEQYGTKQERIKTVVSEHSKILEEYAGTSDWTYSACAQIQIYVEEFLNSLSVEFLDERLYFMHAAKDLRTALQQAAMHEPQDLRLARQREIMYEQVRTDFRRHCEESEVKIPYQQEDIELIIDAMRKNDRILFVPEGQKTAAYGKHPLPIVRDEVSLSTPDIVAFNTYLAGLTDSDAKNKTVLEIGTGTGFQAGIASRLAKHVYTVEIRPRFAETARSNLATAGCHNVTVIEGDGTLPLKELANEKVDSIIVSALAFKGAPKALIDTLKVGGIIVIPVDLGLGKGQKLMRGVKLDEDGRMDWQETIPVSFVRLRGTGKIVPIEATKAGESLPPEPEPPIEGEEGSLMGKLFSDPAARPEHLVTRGIRCKEEEREEGTYLAFYFKDPNDGYRKKPLYTKKSKPIYGRLYPAAVKIKGHRGKDVTIIADHPYIHGFSTPHQQYIPQSAFNNSLVTDAMKIYHEEHEHYWAQPENIKTLPINLHPHTKIRGCGQKIRDILRGKEEEIARFEGTKGSEGLIRYIGRQRDKARELTAAERALIRDNGRRGKKGIELIYGEEDEEFGPVLNYSIRKTKVCWDVFEFLEERIPDNHKELAEWMVSPKENPLPSTRSKIKPLSYRLERAIKTEYGSASNFQKAHGFPISLRTGADSLEHWPNFARIILWAILYEERGTRDEPTDQELKDFINPKKKKQNAGRQFPSKKSFKATSGLSYNAIHKTAKLHHLPGYVADKPEVLLGDRVIGALCEKLGLSQKRKVGKSALHIRPNLIRAIYKVIYREVLDGREPTKKELGKFDRYKKRDGPPSSSDDLGPAIGAVLRGNYGGWATFFTSLGYEIDEPMTYPGAFLKVLYQDLHDGNAPTSEQLYEFAIPRNRGRNLSVKDCPNAARPAKDHYGGLTAVGPWLGFGVSRPVEQSSLSKWRVYAWELYIFMYHKLPTLKELDEFMKPAKKEGLMMPTTDEFRAKGRDDLVKYTKYHGGEKAVAKKLGLKVKPKNARQKAREHLIKELMSLYEEHGYLEIWANLPPALRDALSKHFDKDNGEPDGEEESGGELGRAKEAFLRVLALERPLEFVNVAFAILEEGGLFDEFEYLSRVYDSEGVEEHLSLVLPAGEQERLENILKVIIKRMARYEPSNLSYLVEDEELREQLDEEIEFEAEVERVAAEEAERMEFADEPGDTRIELADMDTRIKINGAISDKDGTPAEVSEPEETDEPVKRAYGRTDGGRTLPKLEDLEREEVATISREQVQKLIKFVKNRPRKVWPDEREYEIQVDNFLQYIFGRHGTPEIEKLKEIFKHMLMKVEENIDFRARLLEALISPPARKGTVYRDSKLWGKSSNLGVESIQFALSSGFATDSARYYDEENNQAIIVFDRDFFNIDKHIPPTDTESIEAAKHARAERLMHELKHDNRIGTRDEEFDEEADIIANFDVRLWRTTGSLGMQDKIRRMRERYPKVKDTMHQSGDFFEMMPGWAKISDISKRINAIKVFLERIFPTVPVGDRMHAKSYPTPAKKELVVVLYPGHPDYQKVFKPGLPAEDVLSETLPGYIEQELPEGARLFFLVTPDTAENYDDYIIFGFIPISKTDLIDTIDYMAGAVRLSEDFANAPLVLANANSKKSAGVEIETVISLEEARTMVLAAKGAISESENAQNEIARVEDLLDLARIALKETSKLVRANAAGKALLKAEEAGKAVESAGSHEEKAKEAITKAEKSQEQAGGGEIVNDAVSRARKAVDEAIDEVIRQLDTEVTQAITAAETALAKEKVSSGSRPEAEETTGKPSMKTPTSRATAPKPAVKASLEIPPEVEHTPLMKLILLILDPDKFESRSFQVSKQLFYELINFFEEPGKNGYPKPTRLEKKASGHASAITDWELIKRLEGNVEGRRKAYKVGQSASDIRIIAELQKERLKWEYRAFTATIWRAMEGMRIDEDAPDMPNVTDYANGNVPTGELVQFVRNAALYASRYNHYSYLPTWETSGCGPEEDYEAFKREETHMPIAINSILAIRRVGGEPLLRCFPDLAEQFVLNEITDVEYIKPIPLGQNPPGLNIRFANPIVRPLDKGVVKSFSVVLLKNRWDQKPGGSVEDDRASVEFDADFVWSLCFSKEDPATRRAEKKRALFSLINDGRAVIRGPYACLTKKGTHLFAELIGRNPAEREAIYCQVIAVIAGAKVLQQYNEELELSTKMLPATEKVRRDLKRRFESKQNAIQAEWEKAERVFSHLGVPEWADDPAKRERLGALDKRLEDAAHEGTYGYVFKLLFERVNNKWVVSNEHVRAIVACLKKVDSILMRSQKWVRENLLADRASEETRYLHAALNLALFHGLPRIEKRIGQAAIASYEAHLVDICASALELDPGRIRKIFNLTEEDTGKQVDDDLDMEELEDGWMSDRMDLMNLLEEGFEEKVTDMMHELISDIADKAVRLESTRKAVSGEGNKMPTLDFATMGKVAQKQDDLYREYLEVLKKFVVVTLSGEGATGEAAEPGNKYDKILKAREHAEKKNYADAMKSTEEAILAFKGDDEEEILEIFLTRLKRAGMSKGERKAEELKEEAGKLLANSNADVRELISNNRPVVGFLGSVQSGNLPETGKIKKCLTAIRRDGVAGPSFKWCNDLEALATEVEKLAKSKHFIGGDAAKVPSKTGKSWDPIGKDKGELVKTFEPDNETVARIWEVASKTQESETGSPLGGRAPPIVKIVIHEANGRKFFHSNKPNEPDLQAFPKYEDGVLTIHVTKNHWKHELSKNQDNILTQIIAHEIWDKVLNNMPGDHSHGAACDFEKNFATKLAEKHDMSDRIKFCVDEAARRAVRRTGDAGYFEQFVAEHDRDKRGKFFEYVREIRNILPPPPETFPQKVEECPAIDMEMVAKRFNMFMGSATRRAWAERHRLVGHAAVDTVANGEGIPTIGLTQLLIKKYDMDMGWLLYGIRTETFLRLKLATFQLDEAMLLLAKKIWLIRLQAGQTRGQMDKTLGFLHGGYGHLEQDELPNMLTIEKLAKISGVASNELAGDDLLAQLHGKSERLVGSESRVRTGDVNEYIVSFDEKKRAKDEADPRHKWAVGDAAVHKEGYIRGEIIFVGQSNHLPNALREICDELGIYVPEKVVVFQFGDTGIAKGYRFFTPGEATDNLIYLKR